MNEEKDRFGDFVSLLERAREDVYFEQKDRELIDQLRRRLEKSQPDQRGYQTLNCPQCGISLQNSTLMDVAVSRCPECRGIWVNDTALQHFLNLKKLEPDDAYRWSKHSLRYVWPGNRGDAVR